MRRALIVFLLFVLAPTVWAQLPPTTHRITPVDSAVDLPNAPSQGARVESVSPSFKTAWAPRGAGYVLKADATLNSRPLTVQLWANVKSADQYNIFAAYEPKSSPRHWEFFVERGSQLPTLFIPGNQPDHLRGTTKMADGRWRFLELVMDTDRIELYVDGKREAQAPYNRTNSTPPEQTELGLGTLVEKSLGMPTAALDNLRISRAACTFGSTVPDKPLPLTDETILLCDFDTQDTCTISEANADDAKPSDLYYGPAGRGPNTSFEQLKAMYAAAGVVRLDIQGSLAALNPNVAVTLNSAALDNLFPTAFPNDLPDPADKPAKNVPRQQFTNDQLSDAVKKYDLKSVKADEFRPGVLAFWGEQYVDIENQITGTTKPVRGAAEQTANPNALVQPGETRPAEVIVRRIGALLETGLGTPESKADYDKLKQAIQSGEQIDDGTFLAAAAVRRNLLFSHPKLQSIDRIAFLARACYAGCRLTNERNTDRMGGHFATQVYGFNTMRGGGLFTVANWRTGKPEIESLTAGRKVTNKRLSGQELDVGSFYAPDLSYDGKTLYFSYCESQRQRWFWSPQTTWNLFKLQIDQPDAGIEMLTDSPYNDFDVCELPSGRLAFCSERRGGFIRCFAEGARLQVTTSVMHSCKPDGSDIYPISFFETSEWQPSVDNNGMLVYTRWDYTDRENCLGSNFWICAPDGRNPRAPHGNYPFPHHTFADNTHGDHRKGTCPDAPSGLPMTEMQIRSIPGSHKYVFTAAPHHGETFGSVCLLDLRVPNDNHMSQVRRVTPYAPFPESESPGRSQYRYGSPWPLDEQTFLCNCWEDLIVLDVFGNEELVCERELLPIHYDPRLRLSEPIPVRPRTKPPVIPQQTVQGEDFAGEDSTATIGVTNVNICDKPLPADRPIKYLRVLQVVPKPNPWMNTPFIGYHLETTPRIPLGIVPVESDGSAFFEAPAGKQLLFQTLDEKFQAVATMRAVAFVHPGEKLVCTGCHEPVNESVRTENKLPRAFAKAPAKLQPECGPVEPVNFYRLIAPEIAQSCIPCHLEKKKGPQEITYESLRPYVYSFAGGMRGAVMHPEAGGSRSIPGRFGTALSKIITVLDDENHRDAVSSETRHKFVLWIDANAPRYGAFRDPQKQERGELVWPILDVEKDQ